MPTPPQIVELVAYFHQHRDALCSAEYNEEQARRELIEPLFAALDWDVQNAQGYAPAYRDVVQEESIRVSGQTKAPDYTFRVGGTRKFFVEAKKPAVALHDDPAPAYQLRRYAWSAKFALSILTNFAELAVYDCRVKPSPDDGAATARVLWFTCDEYLTRWDELAALFTRDAILKGGFDRFAGDARGKRGTAEVDEVFLQAMEGWRDELAHNLALRNPDLTPRALNAAVQLTLDRIVFLRIAEDRGLEPYGQLQALLNGAAIYDRLVELFRRADDRYNSGLFHFRAEKSRPGDAPDEWTPGLTLDDKPLKELLRALYYPDSPYEFSVIPADILGQVYERFLGKVIRLTAGHRAVVEEKPEVKKAGGVFYTPTAIVETIVQQTVGAIVETQNLASPSARVETQNLASPPARVETQNLASLRILDPACGSGSFLLGAYQFLLDWHLRRYSVEPQRWSKGKSPRIVPLSAPGGGEGWRLSTAERKRILLDHLYGVDIDPQAVEVTKLSLLLKALEGETEETLTTQMRFFQERALPDLSHNIRCGNSLIGPDFYAGQLMLFDMDEQYRINAFDWRAAFPEVFAGGGFDAIIGNPPYIRIQTLKEWAPREVEFYKQRYIAASKGNYDIYVVFVEQALGLLNERGRMGFILPSKFFSTDYGLEIRRLITDRKALSGIVDFGHAQVFENATTYTCLLFLTGTPSSSVSYIKVASPSAIATSTTINRTIESEHFTADPWLFSSSTEKDIIAKLCSDAVPLSDLPAKIGRGSSSGADDVFILKRVGDSLITRQGDVITVENDILRIPIYATDFGRYLFAPQSNEVIIFPYNVTESGYDLKSVSEMRQKFPLAYRYLSSRKKELEARKQFKVWYGFSAPRNLDVHNFAHMLVPLLADKGLYCRLPEGKIDFCLMASGGFSITIDSNRKLSPNYVLGLLNSRLLFWRLRSISNVFRGGWITCTKQYVETLPIRLLDLADPAGRAQHDEIVALVELLLRQRRALAAAQAPHERDILQRQIETADRQLDALVYALYGLTAKEIAIVEGKA